MLACVDYNEEMVSRGGKFLPFKLYDVLLTQQRRCLTSLTTPQLRAIPHHITTESQQNWNYFDDKWKKISFCIISGLSVTLYNIFQRDRAVVYASPGLKDEIRKKYNFIADIVNDVSPTVVNVERITVNANSKTTVSTGSGFIVESNGLIITNAHVIGNHSDVKIRLKDGREFVAKVAAVDESRDIAALKINTSGLPTISLCKKNDFRVGEWVVAIGSPLALKDTVTIGIVSNMHRFGKELGLTNQKSDIGYIQTDATINVGNSGGPLVNLAGEVIGMNTMMASAGIAFAIPIDYVSTFLDRIKKGDVKSAGDRKWIGVHVYNLTQDMIFQIRLNSPDFPEYTQGLHISRVDRHSPANLAGLQKDDVILSMNGNQVRNTKEYHDILNKSSFIKVLIQRKDQQLELKVIPEDTKR